MEQLGLVSHTGEEAWNGPDRNADFYEAVDAACKGDRTRAAELLNRFVSEHPQDAAGWLWLGFCLDDRSRATYCMRRAMELDPMSHEAVLMLERLPQLSFAS